MGFGNSGRGGRGGSFGRGGSRGGSGGFRGGRSGGSFGDGGDPMKPDQLSDLGTVLHASEGDLVCKACAPNNAVPYFNAFVFMANKQVIGRVDEILGPVNEMYFSVKPAEGVVAASFKAGDKVFVGSDKLLPLERFLPKPKAAVAAGAKAKKPAGRGGFGRGGFGGRGGARGGSAGGFRGGRGGPRGAPRGGSGGFRGGRGGSRY